MLQGRPDQALDLPGDQGAAGHRHQRLREAGSAEAVLLCWPGALGLRQQGCGDHQVGPPCCLSTPRLAYACTLMHGRQQVNMQVLNTA